VTDIESATGQSEVDGGSPAQQRSRRAVLAAAAGGAAALAAALARPARSAAAAGSALIIGSSTNNAGTSNTLLTTSSSVVAFELLQNGPGTALMGYTTPTTGKTRGVYGRTDSPDGDGVQARNGSTTTGIGAAIKAFGGKCTGVWATSDGTAIYGDSLSGWGVVGSSLSGVGVSALGNGATKDHATLQSNNDNTTNGMAAYLTNSSAFATAHLYNAGSGQVLWMQNGGTNAAGAGGGDFIVCRNKDQSDTQFRVATDGSAYSDGTFNSGGADFAELLPADGTTEPGDVVAVRADGRLTRATRARQSSVIGVVSTKPGFIGGVSMPAPTSPDQIPMAVVGIVPVKASAENGPIQAGDRLVAASLPGHAMRADDQPEVGTVIGKALAGLNAGTAMLEMLVMLQ